MLSSSRYGQLYTFRIEQGGDQRFSGYRKIKSTAALYTVRRLLSARGALQYEEDVLRINGISSRFKRLPLHTTLQVPDKLRTEMFFNVLAGATGPQIMSGYARIDTVGRSERTGLSIFSGYDPIQMSVPIHFESEPGHTPEDVEVDIAKLERMAGRGNFKGAAQGAPARISISTITTGPKMINLLPSNYQWSPNNKSAPIWWISGIDWDPDAWRDADGNRIRQLCTVQLTQFVRPDLLGSVSAVERNAANKPRPRGTATHDPNRPNIASGVGSA